VGGIATPFGLAMTAFCDSECKLFHALGNKRKRWEATHQKIHVHIEVGRSLVLELMGYLVSYYWNHPVGVGVSQH